MVCGVEGQQESMTPNAQGTVKEQDWHFAQQSIQSAVPESRDGTPAKSEPGWFDYLFGPIPAAKVTSSNRDMVEESRDDSLVSARPQQKASNTTSDVAERMFNGFLAWIDPTPDIQPQATVPKMSAGLKLTRPQESLVRANSATKDAPPLMNHSVEGEAEEGISDNKTPKDIESPSDNNAFDGVQFAVSEDNVDGNDNDSTSMVSKASSAVTSQGKMFGDLDSVPSLKGDTMNDATSVKTLDLGDQSTKENNEASIVEEKAKDINIPTKDATSSTPHSSTNSNLKSDTRRQLLLEELKSTVASFGQYDIRAASISAALGDLFDESKKHDQAIKMHREAVDIYISKLGDDHSTTMDAKLQLGKVLENSGKFDEAINLYYHVTMMRRALRGEKDPGSADSLTRMASAFKKKGEYQSAIKELKRALKIYRESLGDAHEKVSVTVDEIASLYVTLGDFEKASAILEEVVKLKAATRGMKSAAVASTLITLATTYECSEDFGKSMKSLKKAYKIYTDMEGYSSKDATSTLNRIAQLYEAMGDNDRASIAYLGVLRGRKINFGEDHLKVGETYFKLGHTLRHSGQHEKALKCMKEALPIFVSKGVELHDVEMIAEVMHEMALINKQKHRYAESARIFKQELGVRRKIGQAEFPMIARTLNHLGVTEYEMKNNNKSLKYLIEALTIYKDHAERSVECAEVLFNTGLVFESSRNKERALDAYNEAARIFREHGYKDNHPHLSKATRKIERLQSQRNVRK